ncbi:hypothetical protein RB195_021967 [Necator americanus]|uniref:Uncharacterized protein n=1 Tax=Necator americanus TaxID=51031 RepID=A0ABR1EDF9_NECAM
MNSVPSQAGGANLLNGLTAQQLAALSGVLGGQNVFNQAQIAALTGSGLSMPLNNAIASVSQQQSVLPVQNAAHVAVENKGSITGGPHNVNGVASDTSLSSLPWPVVSPVMNVPHFDLSTYRFVSLDVAPSRDVNGFDLPLADVTTLRRQCRFHSVVDLEHYFQRLDISQNDYHIGYQTMKNHCVVDNNEFPVVFGLSVEHLEHAICQLKLESPFFEESIKE